MESAGVTHLGFRWSLIFWHGRLGFFKWHYRGPKRTDWGFPAGSVVKKKKKNPPAKAGDPGSTPASGRSCGKENGNPLQYSCLGNPMDRRAWQMTVHGVTKESDMT